jgi:demethylmenaquinone methyltransferase / 2-methoxy-6-polyprenyl-1,4-benzoquinol methylase
LEENNYTHFGSKQIPKTLKSAMVNSIFSNVSSKYDVMNDLMSFGTHRVWKDIFLMQMDMPSAKLLDMAGGTCDIAKRFYKFSKSFGYNPDITVCDINIDMLKNGQNKMCNNGYFGAQYVNSAAEDLPFTDESFDYYSVAFGIRNFTDIEKSLKEAYRVLKKGGKFICLEFSQPNTTILDKLYKLYSNNYIPALGSVMGDRESYKYLVESIEKFPPQEEFRSIIKNAGFNDVNYKNLSGGIVAIHTAFKI